MHSIVSHEFNSSIDTNAFYLMAEFDKTTDAGRAIWGNIGVRYVQTDLTGNGNSNINGTWTKTTDSNDYSNTLPSVNFNMELTEEIIFRAA